MEYQMNVHIFQDWTESIVVLTEVEVHMDIEVAKKDSQFY